MLTNKQFLIGVAVGVAVGYFFFHAKVPVIGARGGGGKHGGKHGGAGATDQG